MVRLLTTALASAVLLASSAWAEPIKVECGANVGKCPSEKPCCSQYGQCGIGGFCLGGCDAKFSNQLESCVAAPVCQSKSYTFDSLDRVADKAKYLGDSSRYDWVADGIPKLHNGNLLLTMEPKTVGTVFASTKYVWYGNVKVSMKTSRGQGVVTAFILMSDMKDEIDFEWIGKDLGTTETNYYFQGIPDYDNGGKTKTSDTFSNWHTYEIDWTEDTLTWRIDGQDARVLKKSDTYNSTTKVYDYPQTPSRVQLSIWPGGLASNGEGTIEWAGGEIDWTSHPDMKNPGYYYATVKDVEITCYDTPANAKIKGSKSYNYDNIAGLQSNVIIGDKGTILKSFLGSGTNMSATYAKEDSKNEDLKDIETVPGLSGAGTGAGQRAPVSSSGATVVEPETEDQGITSGASSDEFTQGDDEANTPTSAGSLRIMQGGLLALVSLMGALMVL